jgi:phytoene/squalene synthetase
MSVEHYENFPVASLLLPAPLREPVSVIYRFARSADDFADEGDLPAAARLALLAGYRAELDRLGSGARPETPLFREL